MEYKINIKEKKIKIEEPMNLGIIYDELMNMIPDWRDWTIEVITPPISYLGYPTYPNNPIYLYPNFPSTPWITCTSNSNDFRYLEEKDEFKR